MAVVDNNSIAAIFLIIFGTPEVESVIRFGDIPNPSGVVILSMALMTKPVGRLATALGQSGTGVLK